MQSPHSVSRKLVRVEGMTFVDWGRFEGGWTLAKGESRCIASIRPTARRGVSAHLQKGSVGMIVSLRAAMRSAPRSAGKGTFIAARGDAPRHHCDDTNVIAIVALEPGLGSERPGDVRMLEGAREPRARSAISPIVSSGKSDRSRERSSE